MSDQPVSPLPAPESQTIRISSSLSYSEMIEVIERLAVADAITQDIACRFLAGITDMMFRRAASPVEQTATTPQIEECGIDGCKLAKDHGGNWHDDGHALWPITVNREPTPESGKFRKKPVVVDAARWTGKNPMQLGMWRGQWPRTFSDFYIHPDTLELDILTLEDGHDRRVKHVASVGDWIVRGVQGEFYAVKPDIFEATYEVVDS
jgi:hypothetical protein